MSDEPTEFTASGKLYARLVKKGTRVYPDDMQALAESQPDKYGNIVQETYDAYTFFYRYTPELVPPNTETEEEPTPEPEQVADEPSEEQPTEE